MTGLAKKSGIKGSNIGRIVGIMFMSRTYTHMAHLKTSSYSKHKALNMFYDDIVGLADRLAEAAQGEFGKLDIPFVDMKGEVLDPIGSLESHIMMIKDEAKGCKLSYLDNIIQEIEALYKQTLYLLKELS